MQTASMQAILDKAKDLTIQINAADFLEFCRNGMDEEDGVLFHSDRLTAFGLYLIMLIDTSNSAGTIIYGNDYFEDIAQRFSDLMSDIRRDDVLMYFCNLISGNALRMEPGRLVLTKYEQCFPGRPAPLPMPFASAHGDDTVLQMQGDPDDEEEYDDEPLRLC